MSEGQSTYTRLGNKHKYMHTWTHIEPSPVSTY